jgi:hypothetical protein
MFGHIGMTTVYTHRARNITTHKKTHVETKSNIPCFETIHMKTTHINPIPTWSRRLHLQPHTLPQPPSIQESHMAKPPILLNPQKKHSFACIHHVHRHSQTHTYACISTSSPPRVFQQASCKQASKQAINSLIHYAPPTLHYHYCASDEKPFSTTFRLADAANAALLHGFREVPW